MSKTFSDLVQEVSEKVEKSYEGHPWRNALTLIKEVLDELQWNGLSGKAFQDYSVDELTRLGWAMAVYRSSIIELRAFMMANIGEVKARMSIRRGSMRQTLRIQLDASHKAKGWKAPTVDDLKDELERCLAELELELSYHQTKLEALTSYWYSVPTVLDRIAQRINVLMWDKDTVRHYGSDQPRDAGESVFDYDTALEEDSVVDLPKELAEDV
jgi:hypothetical protein